jgi:uncharacterized SAM-binding protein YcdF (DUF218 family)
MPKSIRLIKIAGLVVLIVAILFAFSHEYLLKNIGQFLVYEQSPQKADVIAVLNGRDTERSLAAVDLYNQGFAKLIVIAHGSKQPGSEEFWKRVGRNFDRKKFFQKTVEVMGVPPHAFQMIGDGVTSTYDEAKVTKQFLIQNHYKSILLVTSKWHSRRAYLTFKTAFKDTKELKITVYPSKYDTFDPQGWWKNQSDIEIVMGEYFRLFFYLVTFRISLF